METVMHRDEKEKIPERRRSLRQHDVATPGRRSLENSDMPDDHMKEKISGRRRSHKWQDAMTMKRRCPGEEDLGNGDTP